MAILNRKTYYVYIMTNPGDTVLYTGVTGNLARRVTAHQLKIVEGFTKQYNVTKLIYFERFTQVKEALIREKQIKGWLRAKKIALVEKVNPEWADLSEGII